MPQIYIASIQRSRENFIFLLYRSNLSGIPFTQIPVEFFVKNLKNKEVKKTDNAIADYLNSLAFELYKFEQVLGSLERLSGQEVFSLRGAASGYQREWLDFGIKAKTLEEALNQRIEDFTQDFELHIITNSLGLNTYLSSRLSSLDKKVPLTFYFDTEPFEHNQWLSEAEDAEINGEIDLSGDFASLLTIDKEKTSLIWQAHLSAYKALQEEILVTESNFEVLELDVQPSGLL